MVGYFDEVCFALSRDGVSIIIPPTPTPRNCMVDVALENLGVRWVRVNLEDSNMYKITLIHGNFRILKWRYCTIFLAIFCGDIPLHRPYIGLIYDMVGTSKLGS